DRGAIALSVLDTSDRVTPRPRVCRIAGVEWRDRCEVVGVRADERTHPWKAADVDRGLDDLRRRVGTRRHSSPSTTDPRPGSKVRWIQLRVRVLHFLFKQRCGRPLT